MKKYRIYELRSRLNDQRYVAGQDTLTWQELANEMGVSLTTLEGYRDAEMGKKGHDKISTLEKIAAFFNVPFTELINHAPAPPPTEMIGNF